jgi:hypothetical protein
VSMHRIQQAYAKRNILEKDRTPVTRRDMMVTFKEAQLFCGADDFRCNSRDFTPRLSGVTRDSMSGDDPRFVGNWSYGPCSALPLWWI